MIKDSLREFMDRVANGRYIAEDDVNRLQREILPGGLVSRREAEALLDLDRSLETAESWRPALTRLVVDFVVWGVQPTGVVGNEDALWLATVLEMGGPTKTSMAIAYAILEEAGHVDMALLDFIMRARQQARLAQIAA
jgi:hypothetical protein